MLPLQRLGIWQQFQAAGFIDAHGTAALWGDDLPHTNEYIYSAYGNGWHLQREEFDALLFAEAKRRGVEFLTESRLQSVSQSERGWQLKLSSAEKTEAAGGAPIATDLHSRFVIDASGRAAKLARSLGCEIRRFDKLTGIYRFYNRNQQVGINKDKSTLIESVDIGWWYTAQLPHGQQVIALMTDHDLLKKHNLAQTEHFKQALSGTQFVQAKVQGLSTASSPIVAAAHTQCLSKFAGPGWLAVGDAAFTFDPLSSLGIFKALRMAILASYAVHDFFNTKDTELAKYQHLAQAEFENYSIKHQQYYAEEMRFSDQLFWSRRQAA